VLYRLSYISLKPYPCYREAEAVSTIRKAKNPNNSNATERTLPGSIVFTAKPARATRMASAIHLRPADRGPVSTCTGPSLHYAALRMTILTPTLQAMVHRGGFEPP
jgi:hypothetical protein